MTPFSVPSFRMAGNSRGMIYGYRIRQAFA